MSGTFSIKQLTVTPGVAPPTDFTPQSMTMFTASDKVRFISGFPQKIGGWVKLVVTGNYGITSLPRSIYSYILDGTIYYLIGSYRSLYMIQGNSLYNVTPLNPDSDTLNNVLSSVYGTLGANPFSVTSGIPIITVTDTAHTFANGDFINFSGATTFAGLSSGDINGAKSISNVTPTTYQFTTTTLPTSTTSGGGASVVRASRVIMVNQTNDYQEGDDISIDSVASSVGGIAPADIEGIRIVRNVTGTTYDIVASAFATSSATNAGGNVTIRHQIDPGQLNPTSGYGYGLGRYGVGLYGVGKTSGDPTPPSLWSFDRFGNLVIMTRGNQTGLYSWNTTTSTVPELVAGAPDAINYTFVTDNIAVVLGADNTPNRIQWSDQGNLNTWTTTSENQAGQQDIYGAGRLISACPIQGWNLIFTQNQVYTFRYIGLPFVFETKLIDPMHGLIAPNARIVVGGVCYWMGIDNFYMWSGGNVEVIPSNVTTRSTILNYVFNNLNLNNAGKIFCWYNSSFSEIWWHYPSGSSEEPDSIARYNVLDHTWVPDTMSRSAAEYPVVQTNHPYLAIPDGTGADILLHENGNDDDTESLPFSLSTPYSTSGANTVILGGVYQDNTVNLGDLNWTVNTKLYPNQTPASVTYPISLTNQNLIYRQRGRYWQYVISGSALGQAWRGGAWQELYRSGGTR